MTRSNEGTTNWKDRQALSFGLRERAINIRLVLFSGCAISYPYATQEVEADAKKTQTWSQLNGLTIRILWAMLEPPRSCLLLHIGLCPFPWRRNVLDDWWDQALAAWMQPLSPLRPFNLAAVSLTVCPLPATNTVDYTNPFASNPLPPPSITALASTRRAVGSASHAAGPQRRDCASSRSNLPVDNRYPRSSFGLQSVTLTICRSRLRSISFC